MTSKTISVSQEVYDLLQKFKSANDESVEEVIIRLCKEKIVKPIEIKKNQLNELEKIINQAKSNILSLEDDWDTEGAKSFKKETFDRTADFLLKFFEKINKNYNLKLDYPVIQPYFDGTIELHWKTPAFELLVSFPEDLEEPISLYGDDYNKIQIKSAVKYEKLDSVLIPWLQVIL